MATSAHAATRSAEPNRTYWVTLERPELDIAMGAVTLGRRPGRRPDWSTAVGIRRDSEEEVAFRELDELEYMRRSLRVLELESIAEVSVSELPLAVMIAGGAGWGDLDAAIRSMHSPAARSALAAEFAPGHPAEGFGFAEFISSAPVMPVESSPLNGQSLAAIVKGLGGRRLPRSSQGRSDARHQGRPRYGWFIIIVGTSEAVMTGLNYRIKRWFGVPEDK